MALTNAMMQEINGAVASLSACSKNTTPLAESNRQSSAAEPSPLPRSA
jgi:hypothetical protein